MDNKKKIEKLNDQYYLKVIELYEKDVKAGKESLIPWDNFKQEIDESDKS